MSWLLFVVSLLTVVSGASAGCSPPQWIKHEGQKQASSTVDASSNSNVSTCQASCLAELSCVAIDYNFHTSQCFLKTDASAVTVEDSQFDHYTAQRTCEENGVTCVYKSIGQYAFGGEIYTTTGAETIDACVAGCTDSSCTAFAWEPFGDKKCIKTSEPIGKKIDTNKYTALQKADCTGQCTPYSWIARENVISKYIIRNETGDESAFACQLQCLAADVCKTIAYTASGECYFWQEEDLPGPSGVDVQFNTTSYESYKKCDPDSNGVRTLVSGSKILIFLSVASLLVAVDHI